MIVVENNVKYEIVNNNCAKYWYLAGTALLHREGDLPAIEWVDNTKGYYHQGELHRSTGPALIWNHSDPDWYWYGNKVPVTSQEQFEQWLKLRVFE